MVDNRVSTGSFHGPFNRYDLFGRPSNHFQPMTTARMMQRQQATDVEHFSLAHLQYNFEEYGARGGYMAGAT